MRPEDRHADAHRGDGRDEHRTGADILRDLGHRMMLLREQVNGQLGHGVEHLRTEDGPDRERKNRPLDGADPKVDPRGDHQAGDHRMHARVALRAERVADAGERKTEAAKKCFHGCETNDDDE